MTYEDFISCLMLRTGWNVEPLPPMPTFTQEPAPKPKTAVEKFLEGPWNKPLPIGCIMVHEGVAYIRTRSFGAGEARRHWMHHVSEWKRLTE